MALLRHNEPELASIKINYFHAIWHKTSTKPQPIVVSFQPGREVPQLLPAFQVLP
jgi:hypothetical protein